jgi:hypothetical protein
MGDSEADGPGAPTMAVAPGGLDEARDLVERYLERLVSLDWAAVSACLADDVVRIGPFADVYVGREAYVAFLSDLMPSLRGYSMRVDRILATAASGGSDGSRAGATVLVELTETVEMEGVPLDTAEALVFEVDGDLRITRLAIYIQRT